MKRTISGHQMDLDGGRSVWVGFDAAPNGVVCKFTRPNDDGTPHETVVVLSVEAFWALIQLGKRLLFSGELATSELALASESEPRT
jgi:hypothetical protein